MLLQEVEFHPHQNLKDLLPRYFDVSKRNSRPIPGIEGDYQFSSSRILACGVETET